MTWRGLITAGAMRQWQPRLEEVNREVRQFGVAVPGRVEHIGLRARTLHETGNWLVLTDCFNAFGGVEHVGFRARMLHETGNWLVLTDCSNAFNSGKRTAVIAGICVPALTPFVDKCYGTRPADVLFRVDSGKTGTIACSSGVQHGNPMGPAMFWLALRPGLKSFREEFEREGVEAFAYVDDVSLGRMGITGNTVRAFAFLRREIEDIGIVVNPAKTIALPPK